MKQFSSVELRDLIRLLTVVLFVPWFSWISIQIFGVELEFEAEVVVTLSFLFLGSFWCGWLCPFGNVSYFVSKIGSKLFPNLQITIPPKLDKALRYLKYLFLAAFVYILISQSISYFFESHMKMYKSTEFSSAYINAKKYFVLLVPLLIPRFFCKYICFQKAFYNVINKLVPITRISRDAEKCVSCNKCNKVCPMNIDVATAGKINGQDCINCNECIDSCPPKVSAITLTFFGKKVNPVKFAVIALIVYYIASYIAIKTIH